MVNTPIGSPRLSWTIIPTPAKFEARNIATSNWHCKYSDREVAIVVAPEDAKGSTQPPEHGETPEECYQLPCKCYPQARTTWLKWMALRRFQMQHPAIAKISALYSSWLGINLANNSLKFTGWTRTDWWNHSKEDQTQVISLYDQKAWTVSSGSSPHRSQMSESVTWRWCKFIFVGRASLHALQTKCLILFGTRSCQRLFQNFFWFSTLELLALDMESRETISL